MAVPAAKLVAAPDYSTASCNVITQQSCLPLSQPDKLRAAQAQNNPPRRRTYVPHNISLRRRHACLRAHADEVLGTMSLGSGRIFKATNSSATERMDSSESTWPKKPNFFALFALEESTISLHPVKS